MNDDFLHHLRKQPSPAFLRELKARLDRQPVVRTRRRYRAFARGLIVGLLLGGVAFAITSVALIGMPTSLGAFVGAPVQLLTRLVTGGAGGTRGADPDTSRPAPFGPAWLPTHPTQSHFQQPQAEADAVQAVQDHKGLAVGASVQARPEPIAGMLSVGSNLVTLVASRKAYPHAQIAGFAVSKTGARLQVSIDTEGLAFNHLCEVPPAINDPDIVELARRITPAEFDTCKRNGASGLIELKIAYQAILLARGKLYGTQRLSARELFLALAMHIPDPAHPETLIANPYTLWDQVIGSQSYDRIHFIGPPLDSNTGKLAAALLLEAGCNTYPWIAALRERDESRYEEICDVVRTDGVYEEESTTGWAYTEKLVANPTTIGIFSVPSFRVAQDKLALIPIDGVQPNGVTVPDRTYPASRTLYVYVNKRRVESFPYFLTNAVRVLMSEATYGPDGVGNFAFVPLDTTERTAVLADLQTGKEFQF